MDDVRHLAARAGPDPLCVHWSPASYTFDEGPDAPWISFVDPYGREREDARVYGIELACNAVPLTTDDRPWRRSSGPGPDPATGWVLRIETIRDHMPSEQLVLRLSADASVPVGSIARVELD